MQPRYPPSPLYTRHPARPPARPGAPRRGCRTALFVALGVGLVIVLGAGGLAGFVIGNTLGAFDKYHALPELASTLVTDADVGDVLSSPGARNCPSYPPSDDIEESCQWFMAGVSGQVSLVVDVLLDHGRLVWTGSARAQQAYERNYTRAMPTDVRGVGDRAYVGNALQGGDARTFEFVDGNVDARFTYASESGDESDAAIGRDAALISLGKIVESRLARGGR